MLNAMVIGAFISTLRKEKDLTQVELADRLNVSHQAVSKWERGESLPDIGTLLELSKVFGKTVDHILSGGKNESTLRNVGAIVHELVGNHPEKAATLMNNGEAEIDGFVELAPLLKTSTMRKVTGLVDEKKFTIEILMQLAPFLERDVLSTFIESLDQSELTWEHIIPLAPFIGRDTLKNLTMNIDEVPGIKQIINVAPFFKDGLDQLILKANLSDIQWQDIPGLAPFVNSETLMHLIQNTVDEPLTLDQLINVAPFLEDEHMDRFVELATIESINWSQLPDLAPFISSDTLAGLIDKLDDKEIDLIKLIDIVPFMGKEKLAEILDSAELKNLTPSLIADIAPFVKRETLTTLMGRLVNN